MDDHYDEELRRLASENNPEPRRPLSEYIVTQAELSGQDIPPRKYLLGEWMPLDSFGMLVAPRGIGKSWFCMFLAHAIASGRNQFLGWDINQKFPVLYVDGEMSKADIKERFDNICEYKLDNLHLLCSEMLYQDGRPLCLDDKADQQSIMDALSALEDKGQRPQLIVFDNLSTLRRGINENDNSEASDLLDWLVQLRHLGYTVLVVHHSGKNGTPRGASIIEVPMDFILELKKPENSAFKPIGETRFDFKFSKVRAKSPKPEELELSMRTDDHGLLRLVYETPQSEVKPYYRVLRVIAENGKSTYEVLSDEADVAKGSIRKHLKTLADYGYLEGPLSKQVIGFKGKSLLHEIWPEHFPDSVQDQDLPF
jgi:hypothetical protein